jgi:endonuclease G
LLSDVDALNNTVILADGTVPLRQWLDNAVRLTAALPASADLAKLRDDLAGRVSAPSPLKLPIPHDEIVIHEPDFLPAGFLAGGARVVGAVARVEVPRVFGGVARTLSPGKPELGLGTGWLIAPKLLLTNHHVFAARRPDEPPPSAADYTAQVAGTVVRFDYDFDGAPGTMVTVVKEIKSNVALDYALVELADSGARPFFPEAACVEPLSAANILQHPGGREKQVVVRNNAIRSVTADTVQYFTDTEGGSSGSPVCDDSWRVMALHRASRPVQNVTFQGKTSIYINEGTPISAIIADLGSLWTDVVVKARG